MGGVLPLTTFWNQLYFLLWGRLGNFYVFRQPDSRFTEEALVLRKNRKKVLFGSCMEISFILFDWRDLDVKFSGRKHFINKIFITAQFIINNQFLSDFLLSTYAIIILSFSIISFLSFFSFSLISFTLKFSDLFFCSKL